MEQGNGCKVRGLTEELECASCAIASGVAEMCDRDGLWQLAAHEGALSCLAHMDVVAVLSYPELPELVLRQEIWSVHLHEVVTCQGQLL